MTIALGQKTVKRALVACCALLICGYLYYQMRGIVGGPRIQIATPKNGSAVLDGRVTIKGTSREITSLLLNGRQIFTDAEGHFSEDLLLLDGYNVIEIRAMNRFKRTTVKRLDLVLLSSDVPIAQNPTTLAL